MKREIFLTSLEKEDFNAEFDTGPHLRSEFVFFGFLNHEIFFSDSHTRVLMLMLRLKVER